MIRKLDQPTVTSARTLLRYIRIATTVVCLVLCGLLIVLWARSYWWRDRMTVRLSASRILQSTSVQGKVKLSVSSLQRGFGTMPDRELISNRVEKWERYLPGASSLGFRRLSDSGTLGVVMPYWFLSIVSSTFAATLWLRRCRFSLRSLLIASTLIAVVLGVAAIEHR